MTGGEQRIWEAFRGARKAFMPYAVLGYPTPAESLEVVRVLVELPDDGAAVGREPLRSPAMRGGQDRTVAVGIAGSRMPLAAFRTASTRRRVVVA